MVGVLASSRIPGPIDGLHQVACQEQLGVGDQHHLDPGLDRGEVAEVSGEEPQSLFGKPEEMLSGLITSDKFCLSRSGQLRLDWWRCPLRRRA